MTEQFVTALLVRPGETPRTRRISPVFDSMREIIGANAAELYPFAEPVAVVYNPDGDGKRLPLNILLKNGSGEAYAAIHGAFLLVGVERGEYVSLTGRQTRRFRETFSRETCQVKSLVPPWGARFPRSNAGDSPRGVDKSHEMTIFNRKRSGLSHRC